MPRRSSSRFPICFLSMTWNTLSIKDRNISTQIDEYLKRLKTFARVEVVELKDDSRINEFMEKRGVKVVMDETNNTPDLIDRNTMVGQIYLQPTRTAEFIVLDFNILPTGASFSG